MKYLLFSHGFGVKKDGRGMFTEIAENFTQYMPVMFDYNVIDAEHNEVTVEPYSKQADILNDQIAKIYGLDKNADITLICHSQGCIIPCLIDDIAVDKAVLLAPPKIVGSSLRKNNAAREENGNVKVPRKDGSTTIVTADFIKELDSTNPIELYRRLATKTNTTIIIAKQDEILSDIDFEDLKDQIRTIEIDGDHNFTGKNRKGLIETLSEILT